VEHRDTLTVVMFHRVRDDPRWDEANPRDTVSTDFFADCLRFFRRHYDVVSLGDVMRGGAARGCLRAARLSPSTTVGRTTALRRAGVRRGACRRGVRYGRCRGAR
jgi:hypothetical protein